MGVSFRTGLTLGTTIIATGFIIVLLNLLAKQKKVGIGTILNMSLIGVFVDLQLSSGLIPESNSFLLSLTFVFLACLQLP